MVPSKLLLRSFGVEQFYQALLICGYLDGDRVGGGGEVLGGTAGGGSAGLFFCFGLDMSLKCNVLNHFSSFGFRTGAGECASAASL